MENEKARADRFEVMLEDSRRERDAECERLQQNIDSQKEQLDVSYPPRWRGCDGRAGTAVAPVLVVVVVVVLVMVMVMVVLMLILVLVLVRMLMLTLVLIIMLIVMMVVMVAVLNVWRWSWCCSWWP